MFCPKCGSQLPDGNRFCTNCGLDQMSQEAMQLRQRAGAGSVNTNPGPQPPLGGVPVKQGSNHKVLTIVLGIAALLAVIAMVIVILNPFGKKDEPSADSGNANQSSVQPQPEQSSEPEQPDTPDSQPQGSTLDSWKARLDAVKGTDFGRYDILPEEMEELARQEALADEAIAQNNLEEARALVLQCEAMRDAFVGEDTATILLDGYEENADGTLTIRVSANGRSASPATDGFSLFEEPNGASSFAKKEISVQSVGQSANVKTAKVLNMPDTSYCDTLDSLLDAAVEDGTGFVQICSDSQNRDGAATVQDVITKAQHEHIEVYTFGVGPDSDTTYLKMIARQTGGTYTYAENEQELEEILQDPSRTIVRIAYQITFTPERNANGAIDSTYMAVYQGTGSYARARIGIDIPAETEPEESEESSETSEESSEKGGIEESKTEESEIVEEESEYVLPDSSTRYLTDDEVKNLSKEELRLARNEIFARHGRKFKDSELQAYFNSKSWYHGTIEPDDFDNNMLTEIEKANIALIKKYE